LLWDAKTLEKDLLSFNSTHDREFPGAQAGKLLQTQTRPYHFVMMGRV
jgi:hypothetical protein